MMNIVLVYPQIPQNTGNIARTCAATGASLHLVKPLGFSTDDKSLKRAGLDYWSLLDIHYYDNVESFLETITNESDLFFFTTKSKKSYSEMSYTENSYLIFGSETKGLPEELLVQHQKQSCRIPMIEESRSLNLSNSAAIAVYEALRQTNFSGLKREGNLHRLNWPE
ncbi:MAG: tRNA (uridine(34)/cytosine(34)/5-carboxymethylaminomethyluridine(34)-2'-O)-methyltransferase TrmL [Spirochaetales bacterium]|nr:tRNA (uridine(34)/cytosine(34)/5-carboxymethylaminomethyluridine(34)-2'-O)-methyltransferase TrmL [Spirochaetales bacterium]